MAQKLIQTQNQKLLQQQRLSQQQMLQVKLLEMPITELEDSVESELDDNPALEASSPDDMMDDEHTGDAVDYDNDDPANDQEDSDADNTDNDDVFQQNAERQERKDELDSALESIGSDDRMPDYDTSHRQDDGAEYEERVYGDTTSFYDRMKEQMAELDLTPKQEEIMDYLIGSLDADGLLRKTDDTISDELAIYHNIDATPKEIEEVVDMLQDFDPAGIGARNLKECLLLQIDRKPGNETNMLMYRVINECYAAFLKKHWDKISQQLGMTPEQTEAVKHEIVKLNPKPGAALGETEGSNMHQITPDFIVDTADDGTVTFTLNNGNVPLLHVSSSFVNLIDEYRNNKANMNRQDKEALLYAKQKVDRAKGYIEAIEQRRRTLYITMKAIIDIQHKFFEDGDEADLKPMVLKDVADRTGLDISTISRVSNQKYAQTKWGVFRLRHFFSDAYTTSDGEEMSTRKIKMALRDIIDKENKLKPMSDDALTGAMAKAGFPIARRTIAKYREQLGIPAARLRKK